MTCDHFLLFDGPVHVGYLAAGGALLRVADWSELASLRAPCHGSHAPVRRVEAIVLVMKCVCSAVVYIVYFVSINRLVSLFGRKREYI